MTVLKYYDNLECLEFREGYYNNIKLNYFPLLKKLKFYVLVLLILMFHFK